MKEIPLAPQEGLWRNDRNAKLDGEDYEWLSRYIRLFLDLILNISKGEIKVSACTLRWYFFGRQETVFEYPVSSIENRATN